MNLRRLSLLILASLVASSAGAIGKPIVSRNASASSSSPAPVYTVQPAPVTVSKSLNSATVNGTVRSVKAKPRACYTYSKGVRTGVISCVD